jgi:pilus assembly protein Flp/PilA
MMKYLKAVRISKSGASAAEYALILAIVGGGIVAGALALKDAVGTAMTSAGTTITNAGVTPAA